MKPARRALLHRPPGSQIGSRQSNRLEKHDLSCADITPKDQALTCDARGHIQAFGPASTPLTCAFTLAPGGPVDRTGERSFAFDKLGMFEFIMLSRTWSYGDSNPRPLACHADPVLSLMAPDMALPAVCFARRRLASPSIAARLLPSCSPLKRSSAAHHRSPRSASACRPARPMWDTCAGRDTRGNVEIEERDDRYVMRFDPCGSGGRHVRGDDIALGWLMRARVGHGRHPPSCSPRRRSRCTWLRSAPTWCRRRRSARRRCRWPGRR